MRGRVRLRRAEVRVVLAVVALATPVVYHGPAAAASSGCSTGYAVTTSQPVKVAAAASVLTDARDQRFVPDAPYAAGGTLMVDGSEVSGTSSPQLYTHLRSGVRTYAFPVATDATYFVDMFVAEPNASPGQRVWSVRAEGAPVATTVDVARAAGTGRAWHAMFTAPVT